MPGGARFRAAEPRPLRGRVPQAASPFLRSKIINLSHTFSFPTKGVRKRPNTGIDRIRRSDARNGRLFTEGMRPSWSLAAFSPAGVPDLFPDVRGGEAGRDARRIIVFSAVVSSASTGGAGQYALPPFFFMRRVAPFAKSCSAPAAGRCGTSCRSSLCRAVPIGSADGKRASAERYVRGTYGKKRLSGQSTDSLFFLSTA